MGAVIGIFHSKLDELKSKYPRFEIKPIRETIRVKGENVVYSYCVDINEDISLYFNYEEESLNELARYHKLSQIEEEFNSSHKNLKIFFTEPDIVWLNYGTDKRSAVFIDPTELETKDGKEKLNMLDDKAGFVLENKDYFVCGDCLSIKKNSFKFSTLLYEDKCVTCVEVNGDAGYY